MKPMSVGSTVYSAPWRSPPVWPSSSGPRGERRVALPVRVDQPDRRLFASVAEALLPPHRPAARRHVRHVHLLRTGATQSVVDRGKMAAYSRRIGATERFKTSILLWLTRYEDEPERRAEPPNAFSARW